MGLVIAATFAFALWIVLWAVGISGLDAFLLAPVDRSAMLLAVGGVTAAAVS